jgi:hypothetical protein
MIQPEIHISPDSVKFRDIVRVILHKTIEVNKSLEVYDDSTVYLDDPSEDELPFSKSTQPDALVNVEPTSTTPANEKQDNILYIGSATPPTFLPWIGSNWL